MMNKILLSFFIFSLSANAYLTPGGGGGGGSGNIVSINGDTTAAQLISGGTGITTATVAGNTTVTATGGAGSTFTTISSDVTLACNSYNFVSTAAARSLTLPVPASGCVIYFSDITGTASTNNISFLRHASEQIEGVAATYVYSTNFGAGILVADGTNWWAF